VAFPGAGLGIITRMSFRPGMRPSVYSAQTGRVLMNRSMQPPTLFKTARYISPCVEASSQFHFKAAEVSLRAGLTPSQLRRMLPNSTTVPRPPTQSAKPEIPNV
jgi:hypothetical protein